MGNKGQVKIYSRKGLELLTSYRNNTLFLRRYNNAFFALIGKI